MKRTLRIIICCVILGAGFSTGRGCVQAQTDSLLDSDNGGLVVLIQFAACRFDVHLYDSGCVFGVTR